MLQLSLFYPCVQKSQPYDQIFLSFFAFLPPENDPKNQNFDKNEKNNWRYYYSIHTCVP